MRAGAGVTRTPDEVADMVIDGFEAERFLILTDPLAQEWMNRKNNDLDRWLEGMRKMQDQVTKDQAATSGASA